MGKVKAFHILLQNVHGIYYPGQMVQGEVFADVSEDTKVREIRLRFKGSSNVHWTERHTRGSGKRRRTYTKHYRANESYFDMTAKVLAPGPGEGEIIMKPGQYKYAFNMQLPSACATSFEGDYGRVRYYLEATMDIPWAFDKVSHRPITVIQPLDLNRVQGAMNSGQNAGSKTLCCLCCESGPITGNLFLERTGFVPGEKIIVKGEVNNGSRRTMKNHQINLMMTVNYHARGKTRRVVTEVAELRKPEIEPGECDHWSGEGLVILPLPASGLPGCNIITIDYTVELQVVPSGPSFSLEVPINVTIGTIPLRSVVQQFGTPPANPVPRETGNTDKIYMDTNAAFPPPPEAMMPSDIPPPSYSQSVLGPMKGGYDEGQEDETSDNAVQPMQPSDGKWAPMYTYYNWNKTDPNFTPNSKVKE